jgi:methionyl aminopeptidase
MQGLPEKIKIMKQGGSILTAIMKKILSMIEVGVTGLDLESQFDIELNKNQVISAFKHYEGYPYHLCLGVNDMVVHGFPSNKRLVDGDVISVDMGLIFQGYYSDMARTVVVGEDIHGYQHFIDEVIRAQQAAVVQAKVGNKIGDISFAAQEIIEFQNPFGVVREMVGHGVGERLHMSPDVPGYGRKHSGPVLKEYQTLAIEIIAVRHQNPAIKTSEDGWQTNSVTGAVSAIHENSIFVGKQGGILLTGTVE